VETPRLVLHSCPSTPYRFLDKLPLALITKSAPGCFRVVMNIRRRKDWITGSRVLLQLNSTSSIVKSSIHSHLELSHTGTIIGSILTIYNPYSSTHVNRYLGYAIVMISNSYFRKMLAAWVQHISLNKAPATTPGPKPNVPPHSVPLPALPEDQPYLPQPAGHSPT